MEQSIITKLLATSGVTDLVGSRVRPGGLAKSDHLAGPSIAIHRVSGGPLNTLSGGGTSYLSRVQLDCIAPTWLGARSLATACATALNGWRDIASTPRIDMVHLEDETDDDFSPTDGSDFPLHRVIQDYHVSYDTTGA